jgi:hypothetical protein
VIGGGPAAAVVFTRELRAAALADPRVAKLRASGAPHDAVFADVLAEKQAELAARFDAIHSVERAQQVGSLHAIVPAAALRPYLVATIAEALA